MRSRLLPLLLYVSFSNAVSGGLQAQPFTFTTLAGGDGGYDAVDDRGPNARFNWPRGVAVDRFGNLYVSDELNHTIRRISPDGEVSTLAGMPGVPGKADGVGAAARFDHPHGVALDTSGNLFVADAGNHAIRVVTSEGRVTTLAGQPGQPGAQDGVGNGARFRSPFAVAVDHNGIVWVADAGNSAIRAVSRAGTVVTVAGVMGVPGFADGKGNGARFNFPTGITVGPSGDLFVSDSYNLMIRRVKGDGTVTTLLAANSGISYPRDVAADAAGNVYFTDAYDVVRKLATSGDLTLLAGVINDPNFVTWGSRDGRGADARFNFPWGLAAGPDGTLFLADMGNHLVRKISPEGDVTTLAGLVGAYGHADGAGREARFWAPRQLAVDRSGNLYIPDNGTHVIRKVSPTGVVSTLAGMPDVRGSADGIGNAARFNNPAAVALDPEENLLVTDAGNHTIRKITRDGSVTTVAGRAGLYGFADGAGSDARFFSPLGIACDRLGVFYVADNGNKIIRKVMPDGNVTTLAGMPGVSGTSDGTGSAARFDSPYGLGISPSGDLYVSDDFYSTIRRITSSGTVSTVAGAPGLYDHIDGRGGDARFYFPTGLTVDSAGNVFIADSWNQAIRMLSPDGIVTTVGGPAGSSALFVLELYPVDPGRTDGAGASALFNTPEGVAVGPDGTLFVTDEHNNSIRMARPGATGNAAAIDAPTGGVNVTRRLDSLLPDANEWEWTILRRPAGSRARLSSPTSKSPTFTPDVPDVYVFRLLARGPSGASISEVSFEALRGLRLDIDRSGDPPPLRGAPHP